MITDLIRQSTALQRQIDGLTKPEIGVGLFSSFLNLPGLVGFWPMSSVQRSTGQAYDLSGQARHLTYNGNPTYNIYNNFVPYLDFDGTGDYLSRADETDLDILGSETIYASAVRGLTMGGWFWVDALPGTVQPLIHKWDTNQRSYNLQVADDTAIEFGISSNGTTSSFVLHPTAAEVSVWYFVVGKFTPSSTIEIFVNNVNTSSATAVSALFNSTAALTIGGNPGSSAFTDGRASLCFLCANALPDSLINALFQQSRVLFRT